MRLHGLNAIIKIGSDLVGVLKLVGKKLAEASASRNSNW
jgi:hypothetical protein